MKYSFSKDSTNLIITLDTESGKYAPEVTSLNDPNITLENGSFWIYENGQFLRFLSFDQISTIDGVIPSNVDDAFTKLNTIINTLHLLASPKFKGTAVPTDTPTGTEDAFWIASQAGTYTNFGGVVVSANSRAEISRVSGVFTISQTPLDITSKVNVSDVINTLTSTETTKPGSANSDRLLNEKILVNTDSLTKKADLVVGKNKFNYSDIDVKRGFYLNASGIPTAFYVGFDLFSVSGFISASPGQVFKINQVSHSNVYNCFYDVNKAFIAASNFTSNTVTAPANAVFVRFTLIISSTANIAAANFQIELGSVSTAYEAYKLVVNPNQVSLTDYTKTSDLSAAIAPLITTKADLVLGKNLFDKSKTTDGYYLRNDNVALVSASFCYSDYISVVPSSVYKATTLIRFTTYFDANKTYVAGGNSTASSGIFTIPSGVHFIRFTLEGLALKDACQFELGSVSTAYESYGFRVPSSQISFPVQSTYNNKIACPLKQHFLTTIENNIYLAEFQKRVLPNFILDTTPSVGLRKNDIIRALNPVAGSYSITNALVDLDYIDVMRKNYTAVVTDLSKTTAINVLSIGDSYTDIGQYVKKMGQTIPNVNHVGMCKAATGTDVKREGRSGWTLAQYMTQTGSTAGTGFFSPFLHPVAPYTYYGNTDFWKKVFLGVAPGYEITTFIPWLTTLNINSNGVRATPAVNDVMYFTVEGAYKYWDGAAWTVISTATLNFSFNFSKYLTTWSVATPNVITVLLGMNDFRSIIPTVFDTFFIGWKANLDTFIASAKVANASIKIVIATCNSTEYNDLSGRANAALWEGYSSVIAAYDNREAENIFISDTKAAVDRVFGYSYTNGKPYALFSGTDTIRLTSGDVHMGTDGMNQIGEKLAATIQYIRP